MKSNQRLKRERELRGWSQAKVASEVGTDPATVSRWERGLSFPYPYFREKLCLLFEKNAEALGLVQEILDEGNGTSALSFEQPGSVAVGGKSVQSGAVLTQPAIYDPVIPLLSSIGAGLIGRDSLSSQLKTRLCGGENGVSGHWNGEEHGKLQEGQGLIEPPETLMALYGLPGVGKTSLAVQLAHDQQVRHYFQAGVFWAGLGPRPNVLGHLSRWGTLLGVASKELVKKGSALSWAEAIRAAIGTRPMLLVIDDAWSLEEALALKVGGPHCSLLVTTRFPAIALYFAEEKVAMVNELSEDEGMALLHRLVPGLDLVDETEVRELVRSVGGLPLALTLMGKYLRVQTHSRQPRRIYAAVERLRNVQERLQLSEAYALVERHTSLSQESTLSLQSVIEVSDLRLEAQERIALRALAVFPAKPSTFSEEAAVAVCSLPRGALDKLSDAGLLESRGPERYTLHQTIADYALIKLQEAAPYHRLVTYFVSYIQLHARDYQALELEASNILAALDIAHERQMREELVQGVNDLTPFLLTRALYDLAAKLLHSAYEAAIALNNPPGITLTLLHLGQALEWLGEYGQAEASLQQGLRLAREDGCVESTSALLSALGEIARRQGTNQQATELHLEALQLARQIDHHEYMCTSLAALGRLAWERGEYTLALEYLQAGLTLARRIDEQEAIGWALTSLGLVYFEQGDYATGDIYFQEALALAQQLGLSARLCHLQINLGVSLVERGDYQNAEPQLLKGLAAAHQIGFREMICLALVNLISLWKQQGRYEKAAEYFEAARKEALQLNDLWFISEFYRELGEIYLAQGQYAEAREIFQKALSYTAEVTQTQRMQKVRAMCQFGLAQVALAQGRIAEARHLGNISLAFFEPKGHYWSTRVRQWLEQLPAET